MGAEARCVLIAADARHPGTALLETDELIFRGADGFRLRVPFATLKRIAAVNGALTLDGPNGPVAVELGDDRARRWAERIAAPKALVDKLDLKPHFVAAVLGDFDDAFLADLAKKVATVKQGRTPRGANVVFLRADAPAALKRITTIRKSIARDGAIWVVHPKGAATKVRDVDVFAAGKKAGLTATKVARFSDTHTAEKLVIPAARR